ncbi:MAG: transcription-repair coupling factor [Candidatus Cloacimonadota bacterium]
MTLFPKLLPHLSRSAFFSEVISKAEQGLSAQYYHLNQSARALLAAALFEKTGKNLVLISQDDIIAEELWEDICALIGRDKAFYLPDYEILPYEERSPHYSIRATRMEVMLRAVSETPAIYSLSIRAALRYLPPVDSLRRHIITLKQGDEYPPQELLQALANMGYETEYQVNKVFQVARRGGILDVFSPPLNKPVRLEYYGDEIVSIRIFSPQSQRSEPGEIGSAILIPARELALDEVRKSSPIIAQIRNNGYFEGIENYNSLLLDELACFPDYFAADNRLLIWNNYPYVAEEMEQLLEQCVQQYKREKKNHSQAKLPKPEQILASEAFVHSLFQSSVNLFLSQSEFVLPFKIAAHRAPMSSASPINGDLNVLSERLRHLQSTGKDAILLFDNQSQSKRMQELLDDYKIACQRHLGVLHEGFYLEDAGLEVFTDHEIFNRYKRKRYAPRYAPGEEIVDYENLKPGDYVVHVDHGIALFEGLQIIKLDGQDVECLVLQYANEDRVYVPTFQLQLLSKYVAEEGSKPTLSKLGSAKWNSTKQKAQEQIELIAKDLVKLYAERSSRPGIPHKPDTDWQTGLESSFIYEDTVDQAKATLEIKSDMELPVPMERLLCGDVGFGKTEVAIRAAFKAVCSGYQVAVLVPTTLLAEQHYRVFRERMAQYPVRISMFSRFRSSQQVSRDLVGIAMGEIDIAIGTHRLLSADVHFRRLGLLIIDEEHRFGVRHKERLRRLQTNVDTLYMSATPIPRTLNLALAKLKEISLMQTSPKERLPIRTIITPRDLEVIKDAIRREVDRGGQVFFIHNRVQTIETVVAELREAMPSVSFGVGHAQMPEHHLETVMDAFVNREFQVLVSTTIVENGIDISNANTILIDRADTFGLAQLYQMRGRVGRSNRRAYAYLLIPKNTTFDARQRLEALTQYDYLGAGFQVALRDLELRGAGTILGTKQSGIIQSIGFNYYNKLLSSAIDIAENGGNPTPEDSPEKRLQLKTEIDLYLPADYIDDDEERLRIYRRISALESVEELDELSTELTDRFGKIPQKASWLLLYFKLKLLTQKADLEACQVRNGQITIDFRQTALPPKQVLLGLGSRLKHPFRFDLSSGLRLVIELDQHLDYLSQFEVAIQSLEEYILLSSTAAK